jgi:hypothetical protein
MSKPPVVVCGFMTTCPIAGVVWQHLHYIVGLQRLGFDVTYIEDTARYPYNPQTFETGPEAHGGVAAITQRLAARYGFRWSYRSRIEDPWQIYGDLTECQIRDAFSNALMTFNLCGAQELHEDVLRSPCLVYVESDPGVEQIKLDKQDEGTRRYLSSHRFHFTFGESIGQPGCPLPTGGFHWHPTRQPVIIDFWTNNAPPPKDGERLPTRWTSIANWETKGKDIVWKGQIYYWSKTFEFLKFSDLPTRVPDSIWELATDMDADPASRSLYERQRWRLTKPHALSSDYDAYVAFIQSSGGEWTVAKDQYVRLKTGWFSDRSACYLAAGRPVITQETGFSAHLPVGKGLFAFNCLAEIQSAVEEVGRDYASNSKAALEIAREYFDAEKVIGKMVSVIGGG